MRRLYGLDALRGVAALTVAFHHLATTNGRPGVPSLAFFAVDLFFVLSGFVMARTYEERLRNGLTPSGFVLIRYRRLFTQLAIGTTLGLLWIVTSRGSSWELLAAYVLALAFLPAFWSGTAFPFNLPAWSLFLEIVANALHGAIFAKLRTKAVFILWGVSALLFCVLYVFGWSRWDYDILPILSTFPREISCYLMGILIFRTWGDQPLGNRWLLAFLGVTAGLVAVVPSIAVAGTLILAPLLLRSSLTIGKSQTAVWLGALSYPLYATHVPVMNLLWGLPPFVSLSAALTVATVSTYLFEMRRKSEPVELRQAYTRG